MDINSTSITVGSIMALVGIGLTISAFVKNNKKDIQVKATDYAILKEQVKTHETTIAQMKIEIKEHEKELRSEMKRFDELLIQKVDAINSKMDDLKDLIINKIT
jgi:hypothetical protein